MTDRHGTASAPRGGAASDGTAPALRGGAASDGTAPALRGGAVLPSATIELSLLSHTNAGKTTLARTLLRRDIGEVGDRAHVTELAERHVLIESAQGDLLALWDTPGFGDSARLLARLKHSNNPLGWILSQVWDRLIDRPFWSSQQALRNAREQSHLLLYVINAAEAPEDAAYVGAEMQILEWLGKPILVLLNQLGAAQGQADAHADVARWRAHLAAYPAVRGVLSLDAFARCWVQEGALLRHAQALLPPELQPACARLRAAWNERNMAVFERSAQVMAEQIALSCIDQETFAEPDVQQKVRGWMASVTTGVDRPSAELARAQRAMAERLAAASRAATDTLVRLHGLSGEAAAEQLQKVEREVAVDRPADQDKATVLGSILSGAASGLAADLAVGGLSFGAGALIGGVLGAIGARGLAQAYNIVRGSEKGVMRWSSDFMAQRVASALLRYLAVAHFGRGRGDFVTAAAPGHFQDAVSAAITARRAALDRACELARSTRDVRIAEQALLPVVDALARDVLARLYPESIDVVGAPREHTLDAPLPGAPRLA
jgi:hypothetical protein